MTKKIMLMLVAIALVAVGSSFATAGAGARTVTAHAAKRHKKHRGNGKRGPRGPRGPAGPAGPQGPAGPATSSSSSAPTSTAGNNFNALVPFNGTESVTIGSFTVREIAGGSGCNDPVIIDNSSYGADLATDFGKFNPLASLTPTGVVPSGSTGGFTAVLATGTSEMVGQVGALTLSSGCLTSGSVAGQ